MSQISNTQKQQHSSLKMLEKKVTDNELKTESTARFVNGVFYGSTVSVALWHLPSPAFLWPCPAPPFPVSHCPTLPCLALPHLALSRTALPCSDLLCPALPCSALPSSTLTFISSLNILVVAVVIHLLLRPGKVRFQFLLLQILRPFYFPTLQFKPIFKRAILRQ